MTPQAVTPRPPKLAVWKFASCDGCQLTLLDCEDELLAIAGAVRDRLLPRGHRAQVDPGPYDLSLVEGSITTSADARAHQAGPRRVPLSGDDRRLRHLRRHPGAAQLRRVDEFAPVVYARPDYIWTLAHLDRHRRPRRRSTSSCAAARSTSTSCSR